MERIANKIYLIEAGAKEIIGFLSGLLISLVGYVGIRFDKNTNKRLENIEKVLGKLTTNSANTASEVKSINKSLYVYDESLGKDLHISNHIVKLRSFNHNDRTAKSSVLQEALDSIERFNKMIDKNDK